MVGNKGESYSIFVDFYEIVFKNLRIDETFN